MEKGKKGKGGRLSQKRQTGKAKPAMIHQKKKSDGGKKKSLRKIRGKGDPTKRKSLSIERRPRRIWLSWKKRKEVKQKETGNLQKKRVPIHLGRKKQARGREEKRKRHVQR